MVVEDREGALVGIPLDSPPMLRRAPKSAFAPIPAAYLAHGTIQCVSALITVSESEPPFFLLNLDLVLQRSAWAANDSQSIAASYCAEGSDKSIEALVEP
jgi:hypothetical protein